MQITVNRDTDLIELYHLSVLFQSLAKARGFVAPVETQTSASQTSTIGEMSVTLNVDTANATSAVEALADLIDRTGVKVEDVPAVTVSLEDVAPTAEETAAAYEFFNQPTKVIVPTDLPPVITDAQALAAVTDDRLDSSGLPWDARIHAGSRERNTDGSWRVRRRPKGVEESEWDATIARVTSELRDLMSIPISTGAGLDAEIELRQIRDDAAAETAQAMVDCFGDDSLIDADVDQFVEIVQGFDTETHPINADHASIDDAGNVTVPIAPPVILPPVVLPPVTITPPAIAPVTTFAQLMVWLTGHTPKDEAAKPPFVARVNEILAANQLTTLQQLGQRAELIPQVLAQFVEAFGE